MLKSRSTIFKNSYTLKEMILWRIHQKVFRLRPGGEVRLKYAYFIRCHDVIKDDNNNIIEIHCKYDPKTLGGIAPDGRKVKSTFIGYPLNICK